MARSRGAVLRLAPMSVAGVPAPAAAEDEPTAIPVWRSVLAPTDLSELGNRAVAYAYALLPRGGTIYLVHVLDEPPGDRVAEARVAAAGRRGETRRATIMRQLGGLVPHEAEARGVRTGAEILTGRNTAEVIAAAAERLAVDVISLGSHGRSGLSNAVLGSVAHEVMTRSRRPVLVIRPPRDKGGSLIGSRAQAHLSTEP